jgi:hypothetical protein
MAKNTAGVIFQSSERCKVWCFTVDTLTRSKQRPINESILHEPSTVNSTNSLAPAKLAFENILQIEVPRARGYQE